MNDLNRVLTVVAIVAACALLTNVATVTAQDRRGSAERQASVSTPHGRTWLYGVRGGAYSVDSHGFFGGGVALPVSERFWFNPNAEWLFVSDIDRMFTVNADLQYDLPANGSIRPWLGAGIGVRHFAKGNGWGPEHSLGLNLLGGLGFGGRSAVIPFVQGKVFLAGDTLFANTAEVVLSAGIRF